jgi:hypothetical protein
MSRLAPLSCGARRINLVDVEPRGGKGAAKNLGVVRLLGPYLHVVVGGAEAGLVLELGGDRAAHQH